MMSNMNLINDEVVSSEDESERITFSGLLRIPWKVSSTSLLLDPCQSNLRAKAVATTQMLLNNIPTDNKSLHVSFTRCPAITFFDFTPPALLIEVTNNNELIYIAYFITSASMQDPVENYEALPIHLEKAKASISKIVNNVLMKVFDFFITPLELNSRQLASFLAVFIKFADKQDEGTACLKFNVPGLPRSDYISASVRVKDLKVVFDFYIKMDEAEYQPICEIFYEKLLNHFKRYYEVDLGHAEFSKISVPDGSFTNTGLMRAYKRDVMYGCLMAIDAVMPKHVPPPPPTSFPSSDE